MHIRPLGFLDASVMTANLLLRYKQHFADDTRRQTAPGSAHHDTEMILLRGPRMPAADNWQADVEQVDQPLLGEWKSAQALLVRLKNLLLQDGRPAVLGKAMIVKLKAGGHVDWHRDEGAYAEAHDRVHLCLVPSPGAWLYCGGEGANLPVGQLTFVNVRTLHSAVNFGTVARIHLIADIRRPDAGDVP